MPVSAFTNTFAGNPLDRASERRGDPAWLAESLEAEGSLAVALWNGQPLVEPRDGGDLQLAYIPARMADHMTPGMERLLFLGLWKGSAVWAVDVEGGVDPSQGELQGFGQFIDLRQAAMRLPAGEASIAATAKSMFEWRRRHRHCAACGEPSVVADGGWKRVCPACEAEHFPRTDPVVIMVPTHGDRCMLGRQAVWPAGMFSALAGFLEPGESIEEACARELKEEAGLTAVEVSYHSTQPWPWPSSLMIGLHAEVVDDQAAPDQTELSEVKWFTRAEARDLLAGKLDGLFCPPPMAIAHQLIKAWAERA